jgi:predicted RNA binding protein YcfA (HicA-like mRNA interferase family)
MSRLPRIRATQVITALQKAGFDVVRVKGSYRVPARSDGRMTVVPVHAGEDMGPGALAPVWTRKTSADGQKHGIM